MASATYESAKAIVAFLENGDEGAALEEMSQYVGTPDLQVVADKSVALGADQATIEMFLGSLSEGETIEVSATAPVIAKVRQWPSATAPVVAKVRQWPWKWIAAGAGGVAVIALASHALRGRKGGKALAPAAAVAGFGRSLRWRWRFLRR